MYFSLMLFRTPEQNISFTVLLTTSSYKMIYLIIRLWSDVSHTLCVALFTPSPEFITCGDEIIKSMYLPVLIFVLCSDATSLALICHLILRSSVPKMLSSSLMSVLKSPPIIVRVYGSAILILWIV